MELGGLQEENGEFGSSHSRRQWVSYEETVALMAMLEVVILKNEGWVWFRNEFGVLSEEMKVFLWWKEEKELKFEGADCCE